MKIVTTAYGIIITDETFRKIDAVICATGFDRDPRFVVSESETSVIWIAIFTLLFFDWKADCQIYRLCREAREKAMFAEFPKFASQLDLSKLYRRLRTGGSKCLPELRIPRIRKGTR